MHRPNYDQFLPYPPRVAGPALSVRRLRNVLIVATAAVVAACAFGTALRLGFGMRHGPLNFIPLLDFAAEASIPAWYSSMLLMLAALSLGLIGWTKSAEGDAFSRHWLGLAAIFFLLSLDEGVAIHERIAFPIERIFQLQGIFYYGWVIPGLLFVATVGFIYLRFLRHLPTRTRRGFILAGVVYVGGALGMEMLEGAYHTRWGYETPVYAAMVAIEETMEMAGVAILVHTLADYAARAWGGVLIRLEPAEHVVLSAFTPERYAGRPGTMVSAAAIRG